MQNIFEKRNFFIVFSAHEIIGKKYFFPGRSVKGHPTESLKIVETFVFRMRGNSELLRLPLKILVTVEEPVSVKDASLCYASLCSGEGGR